MKLFLYQHIVCGLTGDEELQSQSQSQEQVESLSKLYALTMIVYKL